MSRFPAGTNLGVAQLAFEGKPARLATRALLQFRESYRIPEQNYKP